MEPNRTRDLIEGALPLIVLLTLFFLAFNTLQPFLPALVWGIILAVALKPSHDALLRRLGGRRGTATALLTLTMTIVLIVPMLGLSQALLAFLPELLRWGTEQTAALAPPEADGPSLPLPSSPETIWSAIQDDVNFIRSHFEDEIRPVVFWMISEARLVGTFVFEFALGVILAAVLLHRSSPVATAFLKLAERVAGPIAHSISSSAVVTIRSTVFGVLGSAFVQTALASVSFWFVGAPHWPVLAMITFILAMIQIGPILVWVPLSIWLWGEGETVLAVALVAWSVGVVGLSDNLVKMVMVSRGADIPSILAFLGALGGFLTWGIVGLFLGPVVIAVCYQITMLWLRQS